MSENRKSVKNALKDVHSFLNHPMKGGRLYTTYDKEGMRSALKVIRDVIDSLEGNKGEY